MDFEKVILPTVDELTKETFTSEKEAVSCMVSIGTPPTAEKMKFYLEEEVVGEDIEIKYCSDEARRITVAFYDEKNNMMDIKVKTLPKSDAMTKTNYSCSGAEKYKLFIWDGVTPLYKGEGFLN